MIPLIRNKSYRHIKSNQILNITVRTPKTTIFIMNLSKLQQLLNDSVSDNSATSQAADRALAQATATNPSLVISLHLQNLQTRPLHASVSGSILELKNIASKQVLDVSKIGDAAFQTSLKNGLLQALERNDLEESDMSVLGSLVPNFAARYVFKGEWDSYTPSLFFVCKKGCNAGLIALADSINGRIIKVENSKADIIQIINTAFGNPKTQLNGLNVFLAAANNAENDQDIRGLARLVVTLLNVCPVSDLNTVVSRLNEFISAKKNYFDPVKPELRNALQTISNKPGILPRVKRLSTAMIELLK